MRFPVITLSVAGVAVVGYWLPVLADLFVYDRRAVLDGQLWRLFTAPFVHFSASHLVYDLAVFSTAGCALELTARRRFGLMCVLATAGAGLLFLMMMPELGRYGGLSGLAFGAVAGLCLSRIQSGHGDRRIWAVIFAVLIAKIVVECFSGVPVFARIDATSLHVLPAAHAVGVAAAVIVCCSTSLPAIPTMLRSSSSVASRMTLRTIPVGVAYAIWSGIGIALATLHGDSGVWPGP